MSTAVPQPEAPKPETPKEKAPSPDATKPRTPNDKAPSPDAPKPETPKDKAPSPCALKAQTPKDKAPSPDAPEPETPKDKAPSSDAPKPKTPKDKAPSPCALKPQTPGDKAASPDAPEPQTPKDKAPSPDAPNPEDKNVKRVDIVTYKAEKSAPTQPARLFPKKPRERLNLGAYEPDPFVGSSRVYSVDDGSFEDFVTQQDVALVMFYLPDDEKCDEAKLHVRVAAKRNTRCDSSFGAVDCSKEGTQLCEDLKQEKMPYFSLISRGLKVNSYDHTHNLNHENLRAFVESCPVMEEPPELPAACMLPSRPPGKKGPASPDQ